MDEMNNDRCFGTNDNDCCSPEKNDNIYGKGCCGPELKNNNCQKECCKPKELDSNYMDIRRAKCIPILADRIFDCINTRSERMRYIPLEFTIAPPPMGVTYTTGSEICIRKIAVTYDFIGLVNDEDSGLLAELPVIIDILPDPQLFTPSACSPTFTCDGNVLYNTYTSTFDTSIDEELDGALDGLCNNRGIKSKIAITDVAFYVCNLRINVYGKIGCEDFTAVSGPYSGPLLDLGGMDNGIRPLDFIENMCFPVNGCPTMELSFRSKLDVDCIRVNETYEDDTFTALTLVSLLVNLQAYSTIKEELVVYTTPHGFVCDGYNYTEEDNNK